MNPTEQMNRRSVILAISLLVVSALLSPENGTTQVRHLDASQWREDLRFMAEELPKRHKNLFHSMTRQQFESAVGELQERIPSLKDHEVVVEMARITSMIGDGHSGIRLFSDSNIAFRSYPIRFYLYEDGLFVQQASREHAEAVGARVLRIGRATAQEAIDAVRPLIPRDNEMGVRTYAPWFLTTAEILHALGLIEDMERAVFELQQGEQRMTVALEPRGRLLLQGHALSEAGMPDVDWVHARDASRPAPLWQRDPTRAYWFEYLEDAQTVYFQLNEVQDHEDESLEDFAARMFGFIEENDVDRLVIDLRWNRGGNNYLVRPILLGVIKSQKIDQPGKLFAIIGRRTFSAAQNLVNRLEIYTNVIFVGAPTAQNVNSYGDTEKIKLPHSGITVRASYLWWQDMDPRDTRRWTSPQIVAELTSADDRNGRDPALEAILAYVYESRETLKEQLVDALQQNDFALMVQRYRNFKKDPNNKYVDTEPLLRRLGSWLLEGGNHDFALEVFTMNAIAYPNSAAACKDLAEAYLAKGNQALAIENFSRAQQLDPGGYVGLEAASRLESLSQR